MIHTFGEILLRLSTPSSQKIAQTTCFEAACGGAEANVAIALAQWGHEVAHISRLPDNELGNLAKMSLRKFGVHTSNILKGGNRLGTYYLETGAGLRPSQVIYDRAYSSMAEIQPDMVNWKNILTNTTHFHWSGITPAISLSAANTCLEAIKEASKQNIIVSVDLNFRAKLWQYGKTPFEIMPSLLEHCDIIMGGIDAPEKMFGIVPKGKTSTKCELNEHDLLSIADQMFSKFPKTKLFASTLRWIKSNDFHILQGIIIEKKTSKIFYSRKYEMPQMLDRVGGGDAFMAGFLHGLINNSNDFEKIVNFATASSVLKHYTHGDVVLSKLEDIENLASGGSIAISR
jgi:2-dehydro-3-deoxygluconokinase